MSIKKPPLPPDTPWYYFELEPTYHHYRNVKVIDRCEECNHKIGEHFEKRGVRIIAWKIRKYKKTAQWYTNERLKQKIVESVLLTPPLILKMLGRTKKV